MICISHMLFISLSQVHRISQLISESPEPKRSSIHHIPISCESPTEKRQAAALHTPVPAPPADDMKPQNISFIGNGIIYIYFAILFCIIIHDIYITLRVIIMRKYWINWKYFIFFRVIRTIFIILFFYLKAMTMKLRMAFAAWTSHRAVVHIEYRRRLDLRYRRTPSSLIHR